MVKYNWPAYPKWVRFVAEDANGERWGYAYKPEIGSTISTIGTWTNNMVGKVKLLEETKAHNPHWKESLEERPKHQDNE